MNLEQFEQLVTENVPLAQYTTLQIGGPARYFAEVATAEAIAASVMWARSRNLPFFVLGGGSNVVVADAGFPGLVIQLIANDNVQAKEIDDRIIVTVGAGESWDAFVSYCVDKNWAGVECLSGIPGKVGATPIQNVGAYGQEVSETIVSVTAFDTSSNEIVEISAVECELSYRTSRFKTRDKNRFIVVSVTFRLTANGEPAIRYAELQRHFSNQGITKPTLAEVREAVITIRRRKAMVLDPTDINSRSVGSFFVNPVITHAEFEQVKERARRFAPLGAEMPTFPASDGKVKLSAAWLIEQSGFHRGYVFGNVGTSSCHALAIINRGGGTAAKVKELSEKIISGVEHSFGITLIPEPVFVGF